MVLSKQGWVRAAKGYDIDPTGLNYKSGDAYLLSVQTYSNQMVVFINDTGRSYTLEAHTLPSARRPGEPLSGRFNAPSGVHFAAALSGSTEQQFLLTTDAGYGFIANFSDLLSKNKAGKACISVPQGAKVLAPVAIRQLNHAWVAVVSSAGRLLLFPLTELPVLARGKGNKMINIPPTHVANREEYMIGSAIVAPDADLVIYSGKRHLRLRPADLVNYRGERGKRGHKLPQGFQKVGHIKARECQ